MQIQILEMENTNINIGNNKYKSVVGAADIQRSVLCLEIASTNIGHWKYKY